MLDQRRLKELLCYNPDTGVFVWNISPTNSIKAGDVAGYLKDDRSPRIEIRIDYKLYKASRLAWLYMNGEWPKRLVDHIDGDSLNNKWNNLRLATHHQNSCNQKKRRDNTSGYKGVCWNENAGKWKARITRQGKELHLGYFSSKEEAYDAYCKAANQQHKEFARFE